MKVPFPLPLEPMLAKAAPAIPPADTVAGGLLYEPKWDGFRCIVLKDGDEVELASRGKKPLTRYFPEVVDQVRAALPARCALDAELVVRRGEPGAQRLDWEALAQRIHPAASRVAKLALETPAEVVAFDLLSVADEPWLQRGFSERRAELERLFAGVPRGHGIHLTRVTRDHQVAQDWFSRFEGAGLDGILAKPLAAAYAPGKRTLVKIKHKRTAEAVLVGYRVHTSGRGVGSLLLGLYGADGRLFNVGGIAAFTAARRVELIEELQPWVLRDADGTVAQAATDRSRFSSTKDVSFVPLRPERVVEVSFDQLEGWRFRHAVQFLRWRPDRDPRSCSIDQIDRAAAYDLGEVLTDAEVVRDDRRA
ncbi:MAG: ATP-dependent DNA ligase [Actinobacteria bacterium]|nr:ATP-dependent DNA ligase [Actinomycetota bacterium]